MIDLQANSRLLELLLQLDNNSNSNSNGSIATATSTTVTTKTMMTKRPFMTNAENSIAKEQKKETHAERQSRKTLLKTIDNYISAQLAPYPPVDLTLLKVAEQDAKNSKQRERYWNDPQVVAKQAERERIAKVSRSARRGSGSPGRRGRKRLSPAISHRSGAVVTPPRPSSSASGVVK